MERLLFDDYVKNGKYDELINLSSQQLDYIILNEDISFSDRINILFNNNGVDKVKKLSISVLLENLKVNIDKIDRNKIVKILCVVENYDGISNFVDKKYLLNLFKNNFNTAGVLGESEIVLAILSLYKSSSKEISKKLDYKKKMSVVSDEDYFLNIMAFLTKGFEELFDSDNSYFKDNFKNIINLDFLKKCNRKMLIVLYNNGYEKFIVNNLSKLSFVQIDGLLSDKDIRNRVLNKELAIKFNRDKGFFEKLPDSKRNLIAYYGIDCFEMKYLQFQDEEYKNNLKDLVKVKFSDFDELVMEKILSLYGYVSSGTIDFVLRNLLIDKKYLDKMQDQSVNYFDGNLKLALSFNEKYPKLADKIFSSKIDIDEELKLKLSKLAEMSVLEHVDNLSIEEIRNSELDSYSYTIGSEAIASSKVVSGSLDNYNFNVKLFNFEREIIKIDLDCNMMEYDAGSSHLISLRNIYNSFIDDVDDKDIIEIIHDANMMGDILFITENAGLIIWFPPTVTTLQKEKVFKLLDKIKDIEDVSVCLGYAILDSSSSFVMVDEGMIMDVDKAILEINKIKIDDSCANIREYNGVKKR